MAVVLFLAVMVSAALGYTMSAVVCYWAARGIGRPLIVRYGKYLMLPEKKLKLGEVWVARYGAGGIMLGALLPGVRHLVCIAAGLMGLRFRTLALMAFTGSLLWSAALAVFGLLMSHVWPPWCSRRTASNPRVTGMRSPT